MGKIFVNFIAFCMEREITPVNNVKKINFRIKFGMYKRSIEPV